MSASNRRILQGTVIGTEMDKTIMVLIERTIRHPLYKKFMRRSKKYMVHDASNEASTGDLVRISECRPMSKCKRWRLVQIVERSSEQK